MWDGITYVWNICPFIVTYSYDIWINITSNIFCGELTLSNVVKTHLLLDECLPIETHAYILLCGGTEIGTASKVYWHLYNKCNAGNVTDIDFYHIYVSTRKLYNLTIQRCDFCTHHFPLVWIDETSSVEAKSDHYWVVVADLVTGIQLEMVRESRSS